MPNSKIPLTRHGVKDASNDMWKIRAWSANWPEANLGIACGNNLTVLDYDPRHANEDTARFVSGLQSSTIVRTGGGGLHFYFTGNSRNFVDVMPGIDIRGMNGYVVAPPSVTQNPYLWIKQDFTDLPILDSLQLPKNTDDLLKRDALAYGVDIETTVIVEGTRNRSLFKIACRLRQYSWTANMIYNHLCAVNANIVNPPLDDGELRKIAFSAAKYPVGFNN